MTLSLAELCRADAVEVAPRLLGGVLRLEREEGAVGVRITEVEAYMGTGEDPGSHAHRGQTPRTMPMFGPPAHLYVYFTYGMHTCANIVCSVEGRASGCLLRAGEIVEGLDLARERRHAKRSPTSARLPDAALARGPGNLAAAIGLVLADTGRPIYCDGLDFTLAREQVEFVTTPRTGVAGEGGGEKFPWRFAIPGDRTVSPYKRSPKAVG